MIFKILLDKGWSVTLLDEVTMMLKVVLAPLLNEGGITTLPTASPSGEEGNCTTPLDVRLLRLMTTGTGSIDT